MTSLNMIQSELKENLIRKRQQPGLVADSIAAMRKQEQTTYHVKDFLPDFRKTLDEESREKMCLWAFQVVDYCGLKRSTVAVAMNFLDRFMCTKAGRKRIRNRKSYQLAAMTTLYMAIKMFEPIQMEVELMADMSRGVYEADQIVEMEIHVLDGLQWRTHGPTTLAFVHHFMSLLPSNVDASVAAAIMEQARYQTELAVCDYDLVRENQSEVALGAILNAMESLDGVSMPFKTRQVFISAIEECSDGITCDSVEAVRQYMEMLLTTAIGSSVQSVMEARVLDFSNEELGSSCGSNWEWPTNMSDNNEEASPVCVSKH